MDLYGLAMVFVWRYLFPLNFNASCVWGWVGCVPWAMSWASHLAAVGLLGDDILDVGWLACLVSQSSSFKLWFLKRIPPNHSNNSTTLEFGPAKKPTKPNQARSLNILEPYIATVDIPRALRKTAAPMRPWFSSRVMQYCRPHSTFLSQILLQLGCELNRCFTLVLFMVPEEFLSININIGVIMM